MSTGDIVLPPSTGKGEAMFQTDEPLWYNNGRWGDCGYAIPNPAGKTATINPIIAVLVRQIGRAVFDLMHRQEVYFSGPPQKQWWYDLHQVIVVARKRLADQAVAPNSNDVLVPTHSTPTPEQFLVFPIPYFAERIRQLDIKQYAQLYLLMMSDIFQHSDNERSAYITTAFAADVGQYLKEILVRMATKFFGYTRDEATAPNFVISDDRFTNYDPSKVLMSVEMTEERPPQQWWPTENDLSGIRGLQLNQALLFCERWPSGNWMQSADGHVLAGPVREDQGGATAAASATAGSFIDKPGLAP